MGVRENDLESRPKDPSDILSARAWISFALRLRAVQFEISVAAVQRAVILSPDNHKFLKALAQYLPASTRTSKGFLTWHQRMVVCDPTDSMALMIVAREKREKGEDDKALLKFRRVAIADPSWTDSLLFIGSSLTRLERSEAAIGWLRRGLLFDKKNRSWARTTLAHALSMCGHFDQAAQQVAIGLGPNANSDVFLANISNGRAAISHRLNVSRSVIKNHVKSVEQENGRLVVCFVRSVADFDHLVPVLWRWVGRTNHHAVVVVLSEILGQDDFRFEFLRGLPRLLIVGFGDVFSELNDEFPFADMIDLLVPKNGNVVVTADGNQSFTYRQISRACQRRHLPFLALPHGEASFVNRMNRVEDLSVAPEEANDVSIYDTMTFSNDVYLEQFSRNLRFEPNQTRHVLGSTRYCKSWLRQLCTIRPPAPLPRSPDKLVSVLFLTSDIFPIWWEELYRTVKMILARGDTRILVQPHPAHGLAREHRVGFVGAEIVSETIPGTSLVSLADIVLSLGSSIPIEAIGYDKPVLELSYVHANRTLVAREIPETDMRCRDDVMFAIDNATPRSDPRPFYRSNAKDRFVANFLEGGKSDCLGEYVSVLAHVADRGGSGHVRTLSDAVYGAL